MQSASWLRARCAIGAAVAAVLVLVLEHHLVTDHLRAVLALVAAIGAYAIANELAHDAGLYAATVAGIAVANQRRVPISPIVELHEHLSTLILAGVFVVLAARVDPQILGDNVVLALLVLVALVLVVRPVAVAASVRLHSTVTSISTG